MVPLKSDDIIACHNDIKDPGRVWSPVDHISEYIQRILITESDLFQHPLKQLRHPVNVGHYIRTPHSSTAFLGNHAFSGNHNSSARATRKIMRA